MPVALWTFVSKAEVGFAEQPALVSGRAVGHRRALLAPAVRAQVCALCPRDKGCLPDAESMLSTALLERCQPQLWVGWRLPTHAAGSGVIPKPGLGQGAGGGQEAAALTGLPDLLWQGRLEALQIPRGLQ